MNSVNLVKELKLSTTATRITFHWLGMSCKMEEDQKGRMVGAIDADGDSISISKRLYNNKLEVLKTIAKVKGRIKEYWEKMTLPYVDPGVRLLKRTTLTVFHEKMVEFSEELNAAAQDVQANRTNILQDARQRLQGAYNEANYPEDLTTLFGVEWGFPNIDPPSYLAAMNPDIYQQEKVRAEHRLEEAIALAEQAFLAEFKQLVEQLHERLTPSLTGEKKIFRDSAVENFGEFFQRFKALNVGSNEELNQLVSQATELLHNIEPQELRQGSLLRNEVLTGLSTINQKLDPLMVTKPRRKIITPKKETPSNGEVRELQEA